MNRVAVTVVATALTLAASSCSTPPPPPVTREIMIPTTIAGTYVPDDELDAVRHGENVKAYTVGRYVDPNNPALMYERNTVYRIEENATWNRMPNEPFSIPFRRYHANRQKYADIQRPLTAELEAEIGKQAQLRKSLEENRERVSQTLAITEKSAQNTEKIARANLLLAAKIRQLEERIAELLKEQTETTEQLRLLEEMRSENRRHHDNTPFAAESDMPPRTPAPSTRATFVPPPLPAISPEPEDEK
jgi:hypothetical protein